MLETEIKKLTAAIETLTSALQSGDHPTTTTSAPSPERGSTGAVPAKPEPSTAPASAPDITLKDIGDAAIALAKQNNDSGPALKVLGKYGAAKASEVRAEDFPAVLADLKAALG